MGDAIHHVDNWHHLVHSCGLYQLDHLATDCNGNQGSGTSFIWVVDTYMPLISVTLHHGSDDHYDQSFDLYNSVASASRSNTLGVVALAGALLATLLVVRSRRRKNRMAYEQI